MAIRFDSATGQYEIEEAGKPVLRYNYAAIEPGALLQSIAPGNLIYAVARSNYIHPLYGPHGEILTKDWSIDHPHHRGIYWAWPEVDWRGQRGDLHALQVVFARPTGHCSVQSRPKFAKIQAENLWKWKDQEPIVRELATITAWRSTPKGRLIDLEFRFEALQDPVLLARRGTDKYGGLNLRLNAVKDQRIVKHTDPPSADAGFRCAWGEVSGVFADSSQPAGMVILQHPSNPDYPGDWIDYPELNWLQPTFPAPQTRFELRKDRPLTLRYRLWIHAGLAADPTECREQCMAFRAGRSATAFGAR